MGTISLVFQWQVLQLRPQHPGSDKSHHPNLSLHQKDVCDASRQNIVFLIIATQLKAQGHFQHFIHQINKLTNFFI